MKFNLPTVNIPEVQNLKARKEILKTIIKENSSKIIEMVTQRQKDRVSKKEKYIKAYTLY